MTDHLPPNERAAHHAMLKVWDALTDSVVKREGPAMESRARAEGTTPKEAAHAAQDHVGRLLIEMTRGRARLEPKARLANDVTNPDNLA